MICNRTINTLYFDARWQKELIHSKFTVLILFPTCFLKGGMPRVALLTFLFGLGFIK